MSSAIVTLRAFVEKWASSLWAAFHVRAFLAAGVFVVLLGDLATVPWFFAGWLCIGTPVTLLAQRAVDSRLAEAPRG